MNQVKSLTADVLVVGAGLAGLHTATRLADLGHDVLLAERRADLTAGIRTTGIFVRRTLDDFALPEERLGPPIRRVVLYPPSLRRPVELVSDRDEFRVADMPALYASVARSALAAGVRIELRTRFVHHEDGVARLDGPDGPLSGCRCGPGWSSAPTAPAPRSPAGSVSTSIAGCSSEPRRSMRATGRVGRRRSTASSTPRWRLATPRGSSTTGITCTSVSRAMPTGSRVVWRRLSSGSGATHRGCRPTCHASRSNDAAAPSPSAASCAESAAPAGCSSATRPERCHP